MDINQVNMIKKFYTQYLRLLNRKFLLIIVFPVIAYLAIAIVYIISFSKIEFINTQGGTFPMRVTTYFTFIFITFLIIINFFAFFFYIKNKGLTRSIKTISLNLVCYYLEVLLDILKKLMKLTMFLSYKGRK